MIYFDHKFSTFTIMNSSYKKYDIYITNKKIRFFKEALQIRKDTSRA